METGAAQLTMLQRKADEPLRGAISALSQESMLPVAIWTDTDPGPAKTSARDAPRGVMARRPPRERDPQADPRVARRDVGGTPFRVREPRPMRLRRRVEGRRVGAPRSTSASASLHLVFADMPAAGVKLCASRPEVMSIGLETTWDTRMLRARVRPSARTGRVVAEIKATGSGSRSSSTRTSGTPAT